MMQKFDVSIARQTVRTRRGRGNLPMAVLVSLVALFPLGAPTAGGQTPDAADRMLNLASADQPLVHTAIVNAPVADVWKAWTTKEGITSWMVPAGEVDLRVGGKMRTSYTKGSDLTGPDVIENAIISFDPERMLSIKIAKAPERFPFKRAMQSVWTVIYFEPMDRKRTKVICRMMGFNHDDESIKMRLFFMQGNQQTLDAMVKHFNTNKPG